MLVFLLIQCFKVVIQTSYLIKILKSKITKNNCFVITLRSFNYFLKLHKLGLKWCLFCNEFVNFTGSNPIKYIILDTETGYDIDRDTERCH